MRLWDAETGAARQTLDGHSQWVSSVAFSPDGQRVVSGSYDKMVRLWDRTTGAALATLPGKSAIQAMLFPPTGSLLAAGLATILALRRQRRARS